MDPARYSDDVGPPGRPDGGDTVRRRTTVLILALPLLIAGCSDPDPVGSGPTQVVHRGDFGKKWPLTVDSGVLRCEGDANYGAVTLQVDDKVYALNAPAATKKLGRPVSDIWANDPEAPGSKKEVGLLVSTGLRLCEQNPSSSSGTGQATPGT
jgi:Protein of unknown function (DUF2511)